MPLYRNLNKDSSALPAIEPTRRIVRAKPAVKSHFQTAQAAAPIKSIPTEKIALDAELGPVVGWLAIIAGPGCGQVLSLHYGVNDIGRSDKSRVRLDFGDASIVSDNQAAIIYTAGSRRFYLQSVAVEVWLEGQPARGSVELSGGEILQLGQTRLRFVPLCGPDFDWRHNDSYQGKHDSVCP